MFDEQNKSENGYGQSSSGYGGDDSYRPTSIFDTPKAEPQTSAQPPEEAPVKASESVAPEAISKEEPAPEKQPEEASAPEQEQEKEEEPQEQEPSPSKTYYSPDGRPQGQSQEQPQEEQPKTYYSPDGQAQGQTQEPPEKQGKTFEEGFEQFFRGGSGEKTYYSPDGQAQGQSQEQPQEEQPKTYYSPDGQAQGQSQEPPEKQGKTFEEGFEQFFRGGSGEKTYYSPDGRPQGNPGGASQGQSQGNPGGASQGDPNGGRAYYGPGGQPYGQWQQSQGDFFGQPFEKKNDTFGVLALVCAVASILLSCCGGLAGIFLGIFACVFAGMSKSRSADGHLNFFAKTAVIFGIVGIVFGIFVFSINFMSVDGVMQSILDEYNSSTQTVFEENYF